MCFPGGLEFSQPKLIVFQQKKAFDAIQKAKDQLAASQLEDSKQAAEQLLRSADDVVSPYLDDKVCIRHQR